MSQTRSFISLFLTLLILFVTVFAGAQVYKWVDEKGQVHFGDRPPQAQSTEEVALPEGPSEEESEKAKDDLYNTLESRRVREEHLQDAKAERQKRKDMEIAQKDERFKACVRAMQQSEALKLKARIFKLNSDWSRAYLENKDRPKEVARFAEQVKANCKTDAQSQEQQFSAGILISRALNIKCVNARVALTTKELDVVSESEFQEYVGANCPEIDPRGYWIADWIHR